MKKLIFTISVCLSILLIGCKKLEEIVANKTRIVSISGNTDFGNVTAGQSASRVLTVRNDGTDALTISSVSLPNGFEGSFSGNIASNTSQNLTITFKPTTVGVFSGLLTINANQTSGTNSIAISGAGVSANNNTGGGTGGGTGTGGTGTGGTGTSTTGSISDGLIAHYPFNGNALDVTSNANNGAVKNAVLTTGKSGQANTAYEFNGGSYIDLGRPAIGLGKAFTISILAKPNKPSFDGYMLSAYSDSWDVKLSSSGDFRTSFKDLGNVSLSGNGTDYADGKWHHFVVTYNGKKLMTLADNQLVSQKDVTGEILSASKPNILIGRRATSGLDYYYRGVIDDVRIYNRAFNFADVEQLYKSL
ncbi:MAG: choice-of-anchor D domain-containing protein [Bacteroidetes bacterium]|nr:MAG: choice-of-anchor D domain-containing protein [Bacteroidota bacterium]